MRDEHSAYVRKRKSGLSECRLDSAHGYSRVKQDMCHAVGNKQAVSG